MIFEEKKAQVGPIGAVMLFGVFLVMWFIWLGAWIRDVGQTAVTDNSLTGVEAFFFSNLNFIVMIVVLLAMLGWMYFSSQ